MEKDIGLLNRELRAKIRGLGYIATPNPHVTAKTDKFLFDITTDNYETVVMSDGKKAYEVELEYFLNHLPVTQTNMAK